MSQTQKKYFNSNDARTLISIYSFALLPIYGVKDGKCICGDANCTSPGKHPATINGLTDATKDIERLKELWAGRKGLNVGIATGAASGIFVVDIDGDIGEQDIAKLGTLPQTLTATTGRGRHLFFKHPGQTIKTRRGVIGAKVDVRGDGGYVVGPGSHHITGATYEWVNPLEDIVAAPEWLLDAVTKTSAPTVTASTPLITIPKPLLFSTNAWTESDAIEMLNHISPDCGYDEWTQIGMSIHDEGFGFHVFDNWSKGSATKYTPSIMAAKWKSFKKGGGRSFGTVVALAKQGGWSRYGDTPQSHTPQKSIIKDTQPIEKSIILDAKTDAPKQIEYVMARDIMMNTDSNDFVKGMLSNNGLSVVYGESNCGKTFFMTDLCFHVAVGRPWRGLRTDRGGIVYAALEGSYGLKNRVAAYRLKHGLDDALFAMVASQVDFLSPDGNIELFIDCVKRATDEMGSCKMVVVDTLARAIAGGDENSGQDMGMLVNHADRIRYETGSHVSFIHHSGKNKALGARGHSSLRAAVDTEIEISRDDGANYSTIRTVKQREMEAAGDMYFGLERVVLAVNGFAEEVASCVVNVIQKDDIVKTKKDTTLTPMQQFVYDAILNEMMITSELRMVETGLTVKAITYDAFRVRLEEAGYKELLGGDDKDGTKSATQNARVALRDKNKIGFNKRFIWLIS